MKKKCLLLLISISCTTFAQTWQWCKQGGSADALDQTANNRREEVYSIVTDSNKNIYTLSAVGITNLNIDGHPKINFGDNISKTDYALSSFGCDGSYRWSKIIGGAGIEEIHDLKIDSQDNIYVGGKLSNCQGTDYPSRIDNDVTILQNPQDCSLIFLAKFNSSGTMQWFKRPQRTDVAIPVGVSQTASKGIAVDDAGNIHWLVALPPDTYADGAFVNTLAGTNWFILKYDTNGNFLDAKLLDMQLGGTSGLFLKFYLNQYNGNYYFTGRKDSLDVVTIAGQTITNSVFMASFDAQCHFLWKRENSNSNSGNLFLYNLVFDSQSNIYVGGSLLGFNLDSFLGLSVPEAIVTGFVMKVNQTADNLIWKTYYNHNGADNHGAITLKNDEVAYSGYCYGTFTWGNQSIFAGNSNEGTEILLARFDKDTGQCRGLSKIPGDAGYNDNGTSITADASGDYILGGGFGHNLNVNGLTLTNIGAQSDFFIAKYATSPCSPLAVNQQDIKKLKLYPNPAQNQVYIDTKEPLQYIITSSTGMMVAKGIVYPQANAIDSSLLHAGYYLIKLQNQQGETSIMKLIIK